MNPNLKLKLQTELVAAARAAFTALINRYGLANLCAFGMYSDDGAMSIAPSANSVAHLNRHVADEPSFADYYRFSPAEWAYEFEEAQWFAPVSATLRQAVELIEDDGAFEQFRAQWFALCVSVLETLRLEGLFADAIVVFSATDFEDFKAETAWMKNLNNAVVAQQFETWLRADAL